MSAVQSGKYAAAIIDPPLGQVAVDAVGEGTRMTAVEVAVVADGVAMTIVVVGMMVVVVCMTVMVERTTTLVERGTTVEVGVGPETTLTVTGCPKVGDLGLGMISTRPRAPLSMVPSTVRIVPPSAEMRSRS